MEPFTTGEQLSEEEYKFVFGRDISEGAEPLYHIDVYKWLDQEEKPGQYHVLMRDVDYSDDGPIHHFDIVKNGTGEWVETDATTRSHLSYLVGTILDKEFAGE